MMKSQQFFCIFIVSSSFPNLRAGPNRLDAMGGMVAMQKSQELSVGQNEKLASPVQHHTDSVTILPYSESAYERMLRKIAKPVEPIACYGSEHGLFRTPCPARWSKNLRTVEMVLKSPPPPLEFSALREADATNSDADVAHR